MVPTSLPLFRLERIPLIIFLLLLTSLSLAQSGQTIRGKVTDKESRMTLPGVNVVLQLDSGRMVGATTAGDGSYRLEQVPPGRHSITFSYIGYQVMVLDNIIVGSAREVLLDVQLQESATQLKEVEVVAQREGEVRNEMAVISARQFSVEETERYAGSRGDPARMASNYAGVQGADDSRNDIVVRGNSPAGVLYRFEGVNIPNPNHFAISGTSGGPVTILNNKYLANSDFFTGAFPAEFGNATAGVFDLRMRNGNSERHEFSAQLGFLGTELLAEGPLGKQDSTGARGGASYLLSYRYSTLQLFSFMGINVGTDAVPKYQDGAFRIGLPLGKKGHLALWGIGGGSTIDIVLSDQEKPDTTTLIYGENDRDQYFRSQMATVGATWTQTLDDKTYLRMTAAAAHTRTHSRHDYIYRHVEDDRFVVDSLPQLLGYNFSEDKLALYTSVNRKLDRRTTLKAGLNIERQRLNYLDSARTLYGSTGPDDPNLLGTWRLRWDTTAFANQVQPYVQVKRHLGERLTMTIGLNALYSSINDNSFAPLEPRFGLSQDLGNGQKLAFGYGLHSQLQSGYLYYYGQDSPGGNPRELNTGMGLTKTHHFVLGYQRPLGTGMRLHTEVYYQSLFNIPVTVETSSFSLVNTGSGFERFFPDSLQNTGVGRNLGWEVTVERFFRSGYYFLLTASLFDAQYQGSDGVWRNTSFNGRYATNALFAREWNMKGRSVFTLGGKLTFAGGRWYGPVDEAASDAAQEIVYADATVNTLQFRPYFRADLKLGYRWNRPRVTHELSLDLINITGQENILTLTYAPDAPDGKHIREEYQLGFLPIFYYRVDF